MRLGIADHFGWAVAVTATTDGEVVDRRRIELVEPGVCEAPIHYEGQHRDLDAMRNLVAEVRASVERASAAAFDELPPGIEGIWLRTWPPDFPTDLEVQLRVPWEARADAVMYRQVLAEVAEARGWAVYTYDAKRVEQEAAELVGDDLLHRPRQQLGAPWAKDHRVALAATIVA